MELVLLIARQEERLVERTRQERERMDLARDLHEVVGTDIVPRAREQTIALQPEDLGIGVDARRKRSRHADVGVDLEERIGHGGDATYWMWTPSRESRRARADREDRA